MRGLCLPKRSWALGTRLCNTQENSLAAMSTISGDVDHEKGCLRDNDMTFIPM